jgi:predicted regulator of Ras-like GTPase activity (Roadblock/LC7/MglB family)
MFQDSLKKMVDDTQGGVAGLLMGFDGIAVESYVSSTPSGPNVDIATVGMEFSFIIDQVRKAAANLAVGDVNEIAIKTEELTILIRVLSTDYFVAMAVHPDGNLGKGRFVMRMIAPDIRRELA